MRTPLRRWDRRSRAAAAIAALVALAVLGLAVRAWDVSGGTVRGTPTEWSGLPDPPDVGASGADSAARAAVAAAPFQRERQPPEARYRLPEERRADERRVVPRSLRLVGTAVRPGGTHLAAFLHDRRPRVAGPGEKIGELRIVRVAPGSVILTGRDTTVVLHLPDPLAGSPDP